MRPFDREMTADEPDGQVYILVFNDRIDRFSTGAFNAEKVGVSGKHSGPAAQAAACKTLIRTVNVANEISIYRSPVGRALLSRSIEEDCE